MRWTRLIRSGLKTATGSSTAVTLSVVTRTGEAPLGAARWSVILRHLAKLGHQHFLFAGGEPFEHPEFVTILETASSSGIVLVVTRKDELHPQAARFVDTLAYALRPGLDHIPDFARLVSEFRTSTVEALVTANPATAGRLISTVEAIAETSRPIFFCPDDPLGWGETQGAVLAPSAESAAHFDAVMAELQRRRRTLGINVAPAYIEALRRWFSGQRRPNCSAGQGLLAIDPWGRPRACRGARPLDRPVTDWRSQDGLQLAVACQRPEDCACIYDDYEDFVTAKKSRLRAMARASLRTLRSG